MTRRRPPVIGSITPTGAGRLVRTPDGTVTFELTTRDLAKALTDDDPPTDQAPPKD